MIKPRLGEFDWTIIGPLSCSYTVATCGTMRAWSSHEAGKSAAASQGIDVDSYDFRMYWASQCGAMPFSGSAAVGGDFALMNGCGPGSEQTLAHELGHNCVQLRQPL